MVGSPPATRLYIATALFYLLITPNIYTRGYLSRQLASSSSVALWIVSDHLRYVSGEFVFNELLGILPKLNISRILIYHVRPQRWNIALEHPNNNQKDAYKASLRYGRDSDKHFSCSRRRTHDREQPNSTGSSRRFLFNNVTPTLQLGHPAFRVMLQLYFRYLTPTVPSTGGNFSRHFLAVACGPPVFSSQFTVKVRHSYCRDQFAKRYTLRIITRIRTLRQETKKISKQTVS